MLPGGMRVVEMPGAANVAPGTSQRYSDGTVIVSGAFGGASGGDSGRTLFSVMSQDTILKQPRIHLTSGNRYFADTAAHEGKIPPRRALAAGRQGLNRATQLTVSGHAQPTR